MGLKARRDEGRKVESLKVVEGRVRFRCPLPRCLNPLVRRRCRGWRWKDGVVVDWKKEGCCVLPLSC